jgi:hypothetical protein
MTVPSNLVPTRITDLPVAPAPTASGTIPIVIGGVLYQAVFSDVAGTAEVPASRIIAAGTGLTGGGNLTQDRTIAVAPGGIGDTQLDTTGVVAGTYGSATEIPQIIVNAQGRIVGVQLVSPSFAGLVPETRNLFAGSGLLGGGNLTQDRTFSVDFSNTTPQSLGVPSAGVATQPSRDDHVHPPVDLGNAAQRTGILGRAHGGTGENITNLTAGAVWYTDGNTGFLQTLQGAPGTVLRSNGSGAPTWQVVPGTGTVSSVGLALPSSVFDVINSPVTLSGTLEGQFIEQQEYTVFAGPTGGGQGEPNFRNLINADLEFSTFTIGSTTIELGDNVFELDDLDSITVTQNPTSALQLAPKQYVDAVAQGLDVKASCKYATTANLAALNGIQVVDGQSTATGDRILVKNQNDAEENGIYIADDSDSWTRSLDMDEWSEVPGAFCFIEEGSTLADTAWVCTSDAGGTIGVTAINWSQFAGPGTFSAGTGLTLTGTTFSITNTTVTPAAYGAADKTLTATVNAQGQLTALADTPIAITNSQVSGSAASGTNSDITSLSGITGAIATPTYIDFKNNFVTLPTDATGRVYYDNSDQFQTLVFQMNGSVVQHVGQEQFFRIKCQGAITKGQVVSFAGTVGASGGLIGKAATGLTADQANYILGVADETGADNDWIFVSYFGEVKNIDTTGGAENWIQGQVLYYNPAVTGGLTKNKPNTPNAIAIVAAVVNVGSSNGILFVRPTFGSVLGGTDGNVQFGTLSGGDVIVYDAVDQRWENAAQSALTAGAATNLAGGTAGAVPYQTGAGATSFSAAGSAGEFLVSGGTGSPTWTSTISGGTYS